MYKYNNPGNSFLAPEAERLHKDGYVLTSAAMTQRRKIAEVRYKDHLKTTGHVLTGDGVSMEGNVCSRVRLAVVWLSNMNIYSTKSFAFVLLI